MALLLLTGAAIGLLAGRGPGTSRSAARGGWALAGGTGAHRTRTDVPREVPSRPAVQVPVSQPTTAVRAADLAAAAALTWPLPAACSADEITGRHDLPLDTGYSVDPASLGAGARLRRVLALRDGRLVTLDGSGNPDRCDRARWALVQAAIPAAQRAALDQVVLYDYPRSYLEDPSRRGGVRTGFFEPNPQDPTRYRLAFSTDLPAREELLTIAHEVGHVVSLYPDRPRPRQDDTCPWIIDDRGTCAAAGSPMGEFYASTYPPALRDRVRDLYADHRHPSATELGQVYDDHPADFVTRYAATHPTEDFAESYAYWCLWGTSTQAPTEGSRSAGLAKRAFIDREVAAGRMAASCSALRGLTARR
ncbi:hypothetical protein [Arsenicicoccus dermatophilus]|uniref:hypothetical protein n=1 Tax=Arsenicicoccus dermatophilus TaxID=1076331 RepID=UPI001F4CD6EA|nr:hypothetical protein [Arsenicicoccus dermatophilus]MCH8612718.1 hypothetical protein [Arsenicicoccus dermatophilus]